MNFSAPLSFQMSFNHPHVYYPPSYSFSQTPEQIQISKLNPRDLQRPPHQDELYNQLYNDDKEFVKCEPMKKIKISSGYHLGMEAPPAHFLMTGTRNETIKNTNMTSSFHTGCVSAPNYPDQKISSNQKPGLNQGVVLRTEPKRPFEDENNLCLPLNSRGLHNFDNRYGSNPMSFNPNSIRGWPSNFPHFPSNQVQNPYNQLELLQSLQQQMVSSHKAYEQLLAKNMNPAFQNSMYYNQQAMNLYKQAQSGQHALNMNLNAQNQLRMEREAQRKQTEMPVTSSAPVKEISSMSSSKAPGEPILFDDFPEIHLDHSFFPDLLTLESESTYEKMLADELKGKDFDDLDDKKTAASSVSTSHIEDGVSRDISNNYRFDFHGLDHNLKHQEKRELQQNTEKYKKFLNPDKQKKTSENTLLKKREFEAIDNEEQVFKKEQAVTKGVKKIISDRIQVTEMITPKMQSKNIISSIGINTVSPYQCLKPFADADKLKKEQNLSPASSSKESKQAKRGRKPNKDKLLNVKPAQEVSQDDLTEAYSYPSQSEPQSEEQKIEKTRVGRNFQVPVRAFDYSKAPQRRTKAIKSIWNPSLLEPGRIDGFDVELKEIFGQDVTNQEAALKILRGTGMDVDSTVDIFRRNMLYFKAILFPEPKPLKPTKQTKAERSYWVR